MHKIEVANNLFNQNVTKFNRIYLKTILDYYVTNNFLFGLFLAGSTKHIEGGFSLSIKINHFNFNTTAGIGRAFRGNIKYNWFANIDFKIFFDYKNIYIGFGVGYRSFFREVEKTKPYYNEYKYDWKEYNKETEYPKIKKNGTYYFLLGIFIINIIEKN